jgi:hypothetical protein
VASQADLASHPSQACPAEPRTRPQLYAMSDRELPTF